MSDFKRVLARVQTDYGFYIACQTNPETALAGYDLSAEERSTLTDPEKLADVLIRGDEVVNLPRITVTISGKHDWVNVSDPGKTEKAHRANVGSEVEAINQANTDDERTAAVIRLTELLS